MTKIEEDLKEHFKKSPKPIRAKLVQKMGEMKFTPTEIAKMFGVSNSAISSYMQLEINDRLLHNVGEEIEKLNRLKDLHIKTLAKELELKAYNKLREEMDDASYKDTLRTIQVLKETSSSPNNQTNIQINLPEMVKKKFNFNSKGEEV